MSKFYANISYSHPATKLPKIEESKYGGEMRGRTQELKKQQLNLEEWQKLYDQNQQSYLRVRLLAIKHLAEGKSRSEVLQLVNCTYKTLSSWIDKYLEGGLETKHKIQVELIHTPPTCG